VLTRKDDEGRTHRHGADAGTSVAPETPTATIKVAPPPENTRHMAMFERLRAEAVYGQPARDLINAAIDRP
jgi:hypothetical protein